MVTVYNRFLTFVPSLIFHLWFWRPNCGPDASTYDCDKLKREQTDLLYGTHIELGWKVLPLLWILWIALTCFTWYVYEPQWSKNLRVRFLQKYFSEYVEKKMKQDIDFQDVP